MSLDAADLHLDGCPLQCVKNCLRRHGVEPTLHYTLSEFGVRKRYHADFDMQDAQRVISQVHQDLLAGKATIAAPAQERQLDEHSEANVAR
jgi:uncharacterized metal-binding protein